MSEREPESKVTEREPERARLRKGSRREQGDGKGAGESKITEREPERTR